MNRITFLAIFASAILLLYILEMVRRRSLRTEYSILWLAGGIIMLVFSLNKGWLEWASNAAGIYYPPSFLFLIGMFFILLILIHFSITISKLYQMNKRMAQELAILKQATGEERGIDPDQTPQSAENPLAKSS